jgi:hypothetical protein
MTTRGGHRGLVEDLISNRVHVSSRMRMPEKWGAKSTPPPLGAAPV